MHQELREAIRGLCDAYPDEYWQELDRDRAYPVAFVDALTESGYLACLIPPEYGGAGLGVTEAGLILEEINRSGGSAAPGRMVRLQPAHSSGEGSHCSSARTGSNSTSTSPCASRSMASRRSRRISGCAGIEA